VTISVMGLGKLGACLAVTAAESEHKVIGVDIDPSIVEKVNRGIPHIREPQYDIKLASAIKRGLSATTSVEAAVLNSDITFIVVPTPSDPDGAFSLGALRPALADIGRALEKKTSYHLVVVVSTVLPGSCRYSLIPTLAAHCPSKSIGVD